MRGRSRGTVIAASYTSVTKLVGTFGVTSKSTVFQAGREIVDDSEIKYTLVFVERR